MAVVCVSLNEGDAKEVTWANMEHQTRQTETEPKETHSVHRAKTPSVTANCLAYGTKDLDVRTMMDSDKAMDK